MRPLVLDTTGKGGASHSEAITMQQFCIAYIARTQSELSLAESNSHYTSFKRGFKVWFMSLVPREQDTQEKQDWNA